MTNTKSLDLAANFKSGLTVFLVALPLCLGIALASGAPLSSGIYAGIIGGIVVSLISGSSFSVSGPAAGLAVIVFNGIIQTNGFENFRLAILLAGLLQIFFGVFRAGKITQFLPHSVIEGMLSGIGIILIFKQLPYVFGLTKLNGFAHFVEYLKDGSVSYGTMITGLIGLAIYLIYQLTKLNRLKLFQIIPFPLLLIIIVSIISYLMLGTNLQLHDTDFVQMKSTSFEQIFHDISSLPIKNIFNPEIWKLAIILSIVASIETLLCIEATDQFPRTKKLTDKNLELKAQGFGNLISGIIGGLPITSVIVRSSANYQSGATNKLSSIIHGIILLISAFYFSDLLMHIPLSCLATILIFTGFKLAHPEIIKKMLKLGSEQAIPYFATIAGVVFIDLLTGVMIGFIISLLMILKNHYFIQNFLLQQELSHHEDKKIIKFGHHLTFVAKNQIKDKLSELTTEHEYVFDFSESVIIDQEIKKLFNDYFLKAEIKNIKIEVITNENLKIPNRFKF